MSSTPQPPTSAAHRRTLSGRSAPALPAACSCETRNENGPTGQILVLRISGEIDLLTIALVETALTAALDRAPRDLVVDLAGVSFCCVRGFALLADALSTARADGVGYALSGLNTHLDRIATMLWTDQNLVRYRTAAAGVTAIRIDQASRLAAPPSGDTRGFGSS